MKRYGIFGLALLGAAGFAHAQEIVVQYSDDFTESLQEDLGEREGTYLSEKLTKDITEAFAKNGVSAHRVVVTIEDAAPNRPTFTQLSDRIGLSPRSFSVGGLDVTGEALGADGDVLAQVEYDYYTHDIRDAQNRGTWSDARRASKRFAHRLAKALADPN